MLSVKVLSYLMVGLVIVSANDEQPRGDEGLEVAEIPQYYRSIRRHDRVTQPIHRIPRPLPKPTLVRPIPAESSVNEESQIQVSSENPNLVQHPIRLPPRRPIPNSHIQVSGIPPNPESAKNSSTFWTNQQRPLLWNRPTPTSSYPQVSEHNPSTASPSQNLPQHTYQRPIISIRPNSRPSYQTFTTQKHDVSEIQTPLVFESSSIAVEPQPTEVTVSVPQPEMIEQQEIIITPPPSSVAPPSTEPSESWARPNYQRPIFSLRPIAKPISSVNSLPQPSSVTSEAPVSLPPEKVVIESDSKLTSQPVIEVTSTQLPLNPNHSSESSWTIPTYHRPPLGVRPIPKPSNFGIISTARPIIATELNIPVSKPTITTFIETEPTQVLLDLSSHSETKIPIASPSVAPLSDPIKPEIPIESQIIITDTVSSTSPPVPPKITSGPMPTVSYWNPNPPISVARPKPPPRPVGGIRYPITPTVETEIEISSTQLPLTLSQSPASSSIISMNHRLPLGVRPIPKPFNFGIITTAQPNIATELNTPATIPTISPFVEPEQTQVLLDLSSHPDTGSSSVAPLSEPVQPEIPTDSQMIITEIFSTTPTPVSTEIASGSIPTVPYYKPNPPISVARPKPHPRPVGGIRYPIATAVRPTPLPVQLPQPMPLPNIPQGSKSVPESKQVFPSSKPKPIPKPTTPTSSGSGNILNIACELENGYFARQDCDSYIECKKSVAIEYLCPDGLHFNPNAVWPEYPCAYPSEVKCQGNALEQKPNPTGECPRRYGFFSAGGDCTKYISCQEGLATLMNCPPGLVFNHELSTCDWPEQVPSCNPEVFQGFTCPPAPLDEDGQPWDIITNYKYGNSCKNYIACQRGRPRLLSCDVGYAFDESSSFCVESEYVKGCFENA